MSTIITFPGSSERGKAVPIAAEPEFPVVMQTEWGPGRSRKAVQVDIDAHIKARKAYRRAVAWEAACREEDAVEYQREEARCLTAMAYENMMEAARNLLICTPTDPKALVDLLLYLEQNFSTLPSEITMGAAPTIRWHFIC
jgi:hypothetical protein